MMRTAVMITNNGPHPAEAWAQVTAKMIADLIQIEDPNNLSAQRAKMRFELDVADALSAIHGDNIIHVRGGGVAPNALIVDAVAAIVHASKSTPFAEHFARDDVQAVVANSVRSHFETAADVERRWLTPEQ